MCCLLKGGNKHGKHPPIEEKGDGLGQEIEAEEREALIMQTDLEDNTGLDIEEPMDEDVIDEDDEYDDDNGSRRRSAGSIEMANIGKEPLLDIHGRC